MARGASVHEFWVKNQPWNWEMDREMVASEVEWNLWRTRQPPYKGLEEGQTVLLVTLDAVGKSEISWAVQVTRVLKTEYRSKREAWSQLRDSFPQFDWSRSAFLRQEYTVQAPESGVMLAWDCRPVRRIGVPRPEDLQFRPNGWCRYEVSESQLRKWNCESESESDGSGRIQRDTDRRRAVEEHAMELAKKHLITSGWRKEEISDTSATCPYDFECRRGRRKVRVEVKGLSGSRGLVTLTRGEVNHARTADCPMMLVIVSNIEVRDTKAGPKAKGGIVEVWDPWEIDEGRMTPSAFDYNPPPLPD